MSVTKSYTIRKYNFSSIYYAIGGITSLSLLKHAYYKYFIIWAWCSRKNIFITALYIPGKKILMLIIWLKNLQIQKDGNWKKIYLFCFYHVFIFKSVDDYLVVFWPTSSFQRCFYFHDQNYDLIFSHLFHCWGYL